MKSVLFERLHYSHKKRKDSMVRVLFVAELESLKIPQHTSNGNILNVYTRKSEQLYYLCN